MTNVKWVITFLTAIIIVVITLFISTKKEIKSQKRDISELNNNIRNLEEKISTLENENSELENEKEQLITQVNQLSVVASHSYSNSSNSIGQSNTMQTFTENNIPLSSSDGYATVVYRIPSCDYFILENNSGFIVAEWMGGNDPDLGEHVTGNFKSFGTKDFYNQSRSRDCRLWIEDYSLSKDDALEKAQSECN